MFTEGLLRAYQVTASVTRVVLGDWSIQGDESRNKSGGMFAALGHVDFCCCKPKKTGFKPHAAAAKQAKTVWDFLLV